MNICSMKDFDKEQQGRLQFLVDQGAHLHFPFFANTFSLAYHYASCLYDKYENDWTKVRGFLSEHNWEYQYPRLIEGKSNVFYATSQGFQALEERNRSTQLWNLVGVPFTRYRPRFVFVDSRASVQSEWNHGTSPKTFPADLRNILRNLSHPNLELLTDIPDQASVIIRCLDGSFSNQIELLKDPKDALRRIDPCHMTLRLYFFGAPTTTKMHSDPVRFIPFQIPDKLVANDTSTITQVCLAKPADHGPIDDEEVGVFKSNMKEYHERVFQSAILEGRHTELVNVWWAYNRYAERKQHTATFKTTEIFARCLREHHGAIE